MRISLPFLIGFKFPNGHLFRGKRRLVKRVSMNAVETLRKDLEREEQNMFYLRHPYLTREPDDGDGFRLRNIAFCKYNSYFSLSRWRMSGFLEESSGHALALNKHDDWCEKWKRARNDKFTRHRTLADHLSHLKVREDWDFTAGAK